MRDMEKEKRKLYKKDMENNKGRYIREILRMKTEVGMRDTKYTIF